MSNSGQMGKPTTRRNLNISAASTRGPGDESGAGHRWTFLTNHAHVLAVLYLNPEMVLRQVAALVGITERAVQRIVQDLEEEGYIQRQRVGRCNRYKVLTSKPLRHPIEAHRKIGDLLNLINK